MNDKILIVGLGAFGDIINCTPIAKHYKLLNPNTKISWITRKKYNSVLFNNPNIDSLICINEDNLKNYNHAALTHIIKNSIEENFKDHKIIFSSPYMSNKYDGTDRSTLLDIIKDESSGIKEWECDFIPNIFLSDKEEQEAEHFFNNLKSKNKTILVEYENFSEQTPFNLEYINSLCKKVNGLGYNIIFSGLRKPDYYEQLQQEYDISFYHYSGTFLSNARLYNLVDIFVGCCSGLTCLTSSDYCDTSKIRIEVCRGEHWSSISWKHNEQNKFICYNLESFNDSLNGI